MLLFVRNMGKDSVVYSMLTPFAAIALTTCFFCSVALAVGKEDKIYQKTFTSPEEAVSALVAAVRTADLKELSDILGPDGKEIISSGDEVADRNGRARFVQTYEEGNKLTMEGDRKAVLAVGKDGWPLPIPVVKEGDSWRFDTKQGKQEVLNRRIGRNELSVIQACLAYFDAQREYALRSREGSGLPEYAQKFFSTPGTKDGLYWEVSEGEPESPLGPLFAAAHERGYTRKMQGQQPSPYLGYTYRILTAQGKNAPGGAYSYLVNGRMVGGFALIACPAEYGVSGIMTFMVNQDGVVYEKDLGKATEAVAKAISSFDPDQTWRKVEPKYLGPYLPCE